MSDTKQQILSTLEDIFEDTFIEGDYDFSEDLSSEDMEEWDSLSQIRLLTAIEDHYDFQFDITQIEDLVDVASIASAIEQKLAA